MLASIRLLCGAEKQARELKLNSEGGLALRRAKAVPIRVDIKAHLKGERRQLLPKSSEGQGIASELSNWQELVPYTENNDPDIHNNQAKNTAYTA